MARPEDPRPDREALRREEGALAAFFDAARAAPPPQPSPRLVAAILADAAAARRAAPRASARLVPRRPLAALLRPVGGRAGGLALAACLALGVIAGVLGAGSGLARPVLWADDLAAAAAEGAALTDGVDGFYDLALAGG